MSTLLPQSLSSVLAAFCWEKNWEITKKMLLNDSFGVSEWQPNWKPLICTLLPQSCPMILCKNDELRFAYCKPIHVFEWIEP